MSLDDLKTRWEARAKILRDNSVHGQEDGSAKLWDKARDELTREIAKLDEEAVDMKTARLEGGYSLDSLRRFFREGVIPNIGTDQEPLMPRKYLPHKPGYVRPREPVKNADDAPATVVDISATAPTVSRRQVARAVASS